MEKIIKNRKVVNLTVIIVAILIAVGFVAYSLYKANTTIAIGTLPFGGEITEVSFECCNGHFVTVDNLVDNQSIELFYNWFTSRLYEEYSIWGTGPNVVGNYMPGGFCLQPASWPPCTDVEVVDYTITIVGTSE